MLRQQHRARQGKSGHSNTHESYDPDRQESHDEHTTFSSAEDDPDL